VPVDSIIRKENVQKTLHYFSNLSTVRDTCTKEHLSEFVELMSKTKEPNILEFGKVGQHPFLICPRKSRLDERLKEQQVARVERVRKTFERVKNIPHFQKQGVVRTQKDKPGQVVNADLGIGDMAAAGAEPHPDSTQRMNLTENGTFDQRVE